MKIVITYLLILFPLFTFAQAYKDVINNEELREVLLMHKELLSIPNLPDDEEVMIGNIHWAAEKYQQLGFDTSYLETSTLPVLLVEKTYDPSYKTVLIYIHIDGQPVNPDAWDQEDPFIPVLKEQTADGEWQEMDWDKLDGEINEEWRIFARSAADDKAPITMLITALSILKERGVDPAFNIKIIFDPQEEYGSIALLSTLDDYKERYSSDYFIVMDGPAHDSNKPTMTFGCRGIAACAITTYGAKVPQHSGHYGNYVPNPVFSLSQLLTSMKDDQGRVLIEDFYKGVHIDEETDKILKAVPYDSTALHERLGIFTSEKIGNNYQESLQYPSLNIRQIGTSWVGKRLKTVIPEFATASLDVRLVQEADGLVQMQRIKAHIEKQGYYVIDRDPTDEERLTYPKIVKFRGHEGLKAFRTDTNIEFGQKIKKKLTENFGYEPIVIRTMGGTVPIVRLIEKLDVPTLIIPMVNMDNNQHSPNENIRIGNMRDGIKTCLSILSVEL